MEGKVIRIASVSCGVDTADGVYECAARGRLTESDTGETKPLAVGDDVELEPTGPGRGVITAVRERRNRLSRSQPHDHRMEHVIAANVDQLLIVSSVRKPPLGVGIIDRHIIAGEAAGIEQLLCINKIDLARAPREYEEVAGLYRSLGFPVVLASAVTGAGMDDLKDAFRGKTSVLAGHSGVGKSSLINAIQPGLKLKTGAVRYKGRHCTSSVSLLKLEIGAYVVDTPGIRELSLWDIEKSDVAQFFPEIWDLSHECRMPDCVHMHEPDCAVKAALEGGELSALRYDSYVAIVTSLGEWMPPRETDVERPHEQIAKDKRRRSRRTRKQKLEKSWDSELEEQQ